MILVQPQEKQGHEQKGTCTYSDSGAGGVLPLVYAAAARYSASRNPSWNCTAVGYEV